MEQDAMGGTCSTMRGSKMRTKFWSENLKGRDHLGDLGVDGNTILRRI